MGCALAEKDQERHWITDNNVANDCNTAADGDMDLMAI